MSEVKKTIPPAVVRRLTKYYAYVQELLEEDVEWVSSQQVADRLGLTSSTVRQDLSHVNFSGRSQRGYDTLGFLRVLRCTLGADMPWKMVVIGAGNLGLALALHEEFARRDFNICGVFDCDKRKIGKKVGKCVVQNMDELGATISKKKVDVGIIAVPSSAAQGVADLLVGSGVKGILNLALTHVVVPKRVPVVEARMVASLLELSHRMKVQVPHRPC